MNTETESAVTRARRELFASGQAYYDARATYRPDGEKDDLVAWSALVSAGTFAHTVAAILRMKDAAGEFDVMSDRVFSAAFESVVS